MDPNYAQAHRQLGNEYQLMGKYDLWLEEWRKAASLSNDRESLAMAEEVARVYSRSGYKASITREIEMTKQLVKRRYVDPVDFAYSYAELGDKEQAFAWLEKAFAEKSGGLETIKVVPALDQWHSDPRYVDLLKRMGMPQ
jgi:tetratricopeptide (TPR) repeat protein